MPTRVFGLSQAACRQTLITGRRRLLSVADGVFGRVNTFIAVHDDVSRLAGHDHDGHVLADVPE
jgi:hypothetical protein